MRSIAVLFTFLALSACNDPFDSHPWEVEVPEDRRGLNAKYLNQLQNSLDSSFSFAVIGDPHFYYDDLVNVLEHIESLGDMDFILVTGDITDQALMQEFQWYSDAMMERALPFITVIGNHDHLANGRATFELMFGPRNQVFELGGTRFICFDNVEFESELSVDYDWLENELSQPFNGQTIVSMHIQPSDVQLEGPPLARLNQIMLDQQPDAVFMGHLHSYDTRLFPGGTRWAVAPWPRRMEYLKVNVSPDTVYHELVEI